MAALVSPCFISAPGNTTGLTGSQAFGLYATDAEDIPRRCLNKTRHAFPMRSSVGDPLVRFVCFVLGQSSGGTTAGAKAKYDRWSLKSGHTWEASESMVKAWFGRSKKPYAACGHGCSSVEACSKLNV